MTLVSAFCGFAAREIEKRKKIMKPLVNDVIYFFLFSENSEAIYSYHMRPQRTVENSHIQI